MSYSFEEFAKLTDEELRKLSSLAQCAACGVPLQESVTGNRKTSKGFVCSDCYYRELGEAIYEHPIGIPRATGR